MLICDKSIDALFLMPVTTLDPSGDRARLFLEIPETEARRGGLDAGKRSFLILDEYNKLGPDQLFDFASARPTGRFSAAFMLKVAKLMIEAVRAQKARGVVRK